MAALTTDVLTFMGPRNPYLSSQDLRIAQAAADGGFDCSNWPKLRDLLIATKAAVQPTSGKSKPRYPDRYNGPAAFQSSIYPDYWRPDAVRPRKGVVESYRDAARTPSVPAFAKPAHQILGELSQATGGKRAGSPATVVGDSVLGFAKNSNRIPLRPRSNNTKRPTGYFVDVVGSDPKRVKTETSSQRSFGNENAPISADIIDLTQDQPTHIKTSSSQLPSRAPSTRPGPQVRPVPRARSGNHRNKAPRKRQVPQNVIRDDTSSILARCASKLRAAAHSMDMDRESLRERWEIDADLKLQSVTDDLGDLNAKFHECQETMVQATRIVEEKLLHR
ncbi:uncharacterized protein KY384_007102 [Bacidia gigantensis]|uniref:uncharacterized protein n=1 Tax=Bacidia gigantensis TaxID=2732470 RepID=UPI001D03B724|nr:uncharacterized protein KY384_007102 [Bacidia gigantensis]KAG8528185.1 hypothetical protein KY384_007102 [Bacidia gigantensis]